MAFPRQTVAWRKYPTVWWETQLPSFHRKRPGFPGWLSFFFSGHLSTWASKSFWLGEPTKTLVWSCLRKNNNEGQFLLIKLQLEFLAMVGMASGSLTSKLPTNCCEGGALGDECRREMGPSYGELFFLLDFWHWESFRLFYNISIIFWREVWVRDWIPWREGLRANEWSSTCLLMGNDL